MMGLVLLHDLEPVIKVVFIRGGGHTIGRSSHTVLG
jgi:hypothetical protein